MNGHARYVEFVLCPGYSDLPEVITYSGKLNRMETAMQVTTAPEYFRNVHDQQAEGLLNFEKVTTSFIAFISCTIHLSLSFLIM